MQDRLAEAVFDQLFGAPTFIRSVRPIGGGCINETLRIDSQEGCFFLKWRRGEDAADMFEKEAAGLGVLRKSGKVRVPSVLGFGRAEGCHFLLMEFLSGSAPVPEYWAELGRSLASMHRNDTGGFFGLEHDNYIGSLPQRNSPGDDWIRFFIEHRLEPQLRRASDQGLAYPKLIQQFGILFSRLRGLLVDQPPSLLHGDLWSGNIVAGPDGLAWLIDPAVYYGNREIEIAFTGMFGGFSPEFYRAYEESWPLENGYEERAEIYNLYPTLVHLNLFGRSYLPGIERTLRRFAG